MTRALAPTTPEVMIDVAAESQFRTLDGVLPKLRTGEIAACIEAHTALAMLSDSMVRLLGWRDMGYDHYRARASAISEQVSEISAGGQGAFAQPDVVKLFAGSCRGLKLALSIGQDLNDLRAASFQLA